MASIVTAIAIAAVAQTAPSTDMRLLRWPTVHGETVVFTYATDLWVAKLDGGYARRLTSHPGTEGRAKISPCGRWIAFTASYEGNPDVYLMPIEGGEPKRLTFDPEADNVLNWTPDGKILYASTAGNFMLAQQRLWIVDPAGGPSTRTPIAEISEGSMTPDGKRIVYTRKASYNFSWRRYRGGTQGRISIFDLTDNSYSELPARREQNYWPMVVGEDVFYVSDRNQATLNLYRYNLRTRREQQLTRFADADVRWPSTDGRTIVYERDGYLFAYDIESGNIRRINPKVRGDFLVTRPALRRLADNITSVAISPSGARVAVEARGEIFTLPVRTGEVRNMTRTQGVRERWPEWSPDGKTIAYVGDATGNFEVYLQPQMGGEATQLTSAGLPITGIRWSPDSKLVALTTEAGELHLVDVESKKLTKVYRARFGIGGLDFSPDSKWLAYVDQATNGFGQVFLYEIASGKSAWISDERYDDSGVAFDLNGKYLYFRSARTFRPSFGLYEFSLKVENAHRVYAVPLTKDAGNPLFPPSDEEPAAPAARPAQPPAGAQSGGSPTAPAPAPEVKIDFDGIQERIIALPMPAGTYQALIGANNGVLFFNQGTFARFDFASREVTQLATSPILGPVSFNPNRTKMAYFMGGTLGIVDVRPGIAPGQGRVETAGVEAIVDPRQEWRQIYWEAWRYFRDNFYDPGMVGQDWNALGKRYEEFLPHVAHRSDLNYVLSMLISELGTGHANVGGGDMGITAPGVPVGQLGVDYEIEGDFVKMTKIYRGANYSESDRGPLGEPGMDVRDGTYLLAIDGVEVNRNVNPHSLLVGKVGRSVVLTINDKPSREGSRTLRVRPIGSENALRYREFVESARKRVAEASNGRIGYMHIPNTATEGAIEFIRGFYSQWDKDALIIDERWNGGGFIQPWFVDTLARRIRAGIQQRNGADSQDAVAHEGPKAMLINGYAGSGGDFFPWMFRQSRLGPLIGTRTWGGLVGISGSAPLVDGGFLTAPEFAIFDRQTQQIIAENTGGSLGSRPER
ncbi:MAG: PDZ domain-containing protein [Fimbriimonadaceae bacterium]